MGSTLRSFRRSGCGPQAEAAIRLVQASARTVDRRPIPGVVDQYRHSRMRALASSRLIRFCRKASRSSALMRRYSVRSGSASGFDGPPVIALPTTRVTFCPSRTGSASALSSRVLTSAVYVKSEYSLLGFIIAPAEDGSIVAFEFTGDPDT